MVSDSLPLSAAGAGPAQEPASRAAARARPDTRRRKAFSFTARGPPSHAEAAASRLHVSFSWPLSGGVGGGRGQRLAGPGDGLFGIVQGGLGKAPVGGLLPLAGRTAVDPGDGALG